MSAIRVLELPGRRVPDLYGRILSPRGDVLAVRQPDDVLNPLPEVRSLKGHDMQPCVGVECLDLVVPVSHGKAHPIGGPCHSKNTAAGIVGADGPSQVRAIVRVRYPENLEFRQPCQGAAGCREPCESSQFEKCAAREAALPGGRCGSVLRRKELQFLLLQFALDHTYHVGPFACIPVNHLPNQYLERFLRVPGPPALARKSYMQEESAYRLLPCLQLAQDPTQVIYGSARLHGSSRGSRSGV